MSSTPRSGLVDDHAGRVGGVDHVVLVDRLARHLDLDHAHRDPRALVDRSLPVGRPTHGMTLGVSATRQTLSVADDTPSDAISAAAAAAVAYEATLDDDRSPTRGALHATRCRSRAGGAGAAVARSCRVGGRPAASGRPVVWRGSVPRCGGRGARGSGCAPRATRSPVCGVTTAIRARSRRRSRRCRVGPTATGSKPATWRSRIEVGDGLRGHAARWAGGIWSWATRRSRPSCTRAPRATTRERQQGRRPVRCGGARLRRHRRPVPPARGARRSGPGEWWR